MKTIEHIVCCHISSASSKHITRDLSNLKGSGRCYRGSYLSEIIEHLLCDISSHLTFRGTYKSVAI